MPSDRYADGEATPLRGTAGSGRTAYVPLNRGAHPTPSPSAAEPRPVWPEEPATGELPTVSAPAPAGRDSATRGDVRAGVALATRPAGPGTPPPVAAPPVAAPAPGGRPPKRRGWLMAGIAATAVLLGAGAAVLANGNDGASPAATAPQDVATGVPADPGQPGQPSVAPSGVAGLGPNPSASPTGKPAAGFEPFAAPRKTLPGASLHLKSGESFADALRRSDRTFGPLRMVRVFYPGLPPSWNGSRADVSNRTVVLSFKANPRDVTAGRHDARLTSFFQSIPRNVDVYWAYFHEPENDVQQGAFTPAQFAAAFRHVSALADKAKNPRLRATLILMCWTLNPNSRRNFDDYYPGSAAVDVLGWDCYNSGTKNNRYTAPSEVFSRMISKSKQLGKPWGLAETGTAKIASDSSGTGRAKWIRDMSRYLNEQKPLWVAYYDYQVPGGDFRLTDTASQQAWKAWCQASPA